MSTEKIGYNFMYSGKSHYMKSAVELLEHNEIYNILESDEYYYAKSKLENNPVIFVRKRPTADFGITSPFIFSIVAFIGVWAGNKALDELYTKLRPSLIKFYTNLLQKMKSTNNTSFEFQSVVHYDEQDVVVLVRIKIQSAKELDETFHMIIQTHAQGINFLKINGKQASVHEYSIENGKVNIEPNLYRSLDHIQTKKRNAAVKRMTHFTK